MTSIMAEVLDIYRNKGYDLALSHSRKLLIGNKISFLTHEKISKFLSSFEVMNTKQRKILLDIKDKNSYINQNKT